MACSDFRRDLRAYLQGELSEPRFGEMVEHEASCAECRLLVLEASANQSADEPGVERASLRSRARAGGEPDATFEALLARTTGDDCGYVERRLGEGLDEPIDLDLARRVTVHLADCARCRRLRDVLEELPVWYRAVPLLRADRAFTKEVLQRTLGPEPGFFDVLRAWWRKPESLWEAAVVCGMLTFLMFGKSWSTVRDVRGRTEQVIAAQVGINSADALSSGINSTYDHALGAFSAPARILAERWNGLRTLVVQASSSMERAGKDLRTGDYEALLRDLNLMRGANEAPQESPSAPADSTGRGAHVPETR